MRRFGRARSLPEPAAAGTLPSELAVIEAEFVATAARLLHDEAELLDAMHDKDVLPRQILLYRDFVRTIFLGA